MLDPEWPIREADIASLPRYVPGRSPLTALHRFSHAPSPAILLGPREDYEHED